jgi:hypothetical protein
MKRALVIAIMASGIYAGCGLAQESEPELPWVKLSEVGDLVRYVNVESIKDLSDGIKQAWELSSYDDPKISSNGVKYFSIKNKVKYNCIDETVARLAYVSYSKAYGEGDVVKSLDYMPHEIKWSSVAPDTVGETTFKFVCEFK